MSSNTFDTSNKMYTLENNTNNYDNNTEARFNIVLNLVNDSNNKILDVGCYDGRYSKLFLKNGNIVYGIDASTEGINEAKKNGILAFVSDVENIFPFDDCFFDKIHAGQIIEHLYDTDTFIKECNRVLKTNGQLIITTPNTLSLPRRIMYMLGIGRFFEASNTFSTEKKSVGHIRFFTKKLLKDFIESNNFKMVSFTSDYVNMPFFKNRILAKIIPTFGRTLIMVFKKR